MNDHTPDAIAIPLTKGYITYISLEDADLSLLSWHVVDQTNGRVYAARGYKTRIHLHRVILERAIGRALNKSEFPDHIDNDPLNNRRSNLRLSSRSQNNINGRRMTINTSGYRGVSFSKKSRKWTARLAVNGNRIYLGMFDTAEDAYDVYKHAVIEHYGVEWLPETDKA